MKQKLKKILLLYLFTGTLFVSCTMEEEVIRNHNYSKDIKIYQKSFDELIKDSKFATSFNKLPKRKTSLKSGEQARTVMEEQYGFTITNTPVRVMQVGNLTSYTFHIERNTSNSTYFENLVVQNDSIGNTTAHIIKYTPFMPMTTFLEHNSYNFSGSTEFTSIIYDDNISNTNDKVVTSCTNLYRTKCNGVSNGSCTGATHIVSGACLTYSPNCIFLEFQTSSCYSYDDGQNDGEVMSDMDAIGGNNISSGSGTGGTTPIYSDPLCRDCIYIGENGNARQEPCDELKKMGQNSNFSEANYQLKINLPSKEIEQGYAAKKNSTLTTNIISYPQNANGMTSIKLRPTGNQYGSTHHHGRKNYQMFSCTDIFGLYQFSQVYESRLDVNYSLDMFFNMLVTFDYDYVIKIDDLTKLSTITQYFQTQEDALRFDERIRGIYQTYGGGDNNADYSKLERVFLDFTNSNYDTLFNIGNHDFGISLYRRDNTMKSTQSNNWVKLELDENGNIIKKPCND